MRVQFTLRPEFEGITFPSITESIDIPAKREKLLTAVDDFVNRNGREPEIDVVLMPHEWRDVLSHPVFEAINRATHEPAKLIADYFGANSANVDTWMHADTNVVPFPSRN